MASIFAFLAIAFLFIVMFTAAACVAYVAIRPNVARHFVSYSHKDAESAKQIMAYLRDTKLKVWIDFGVAIRRDRLAARLMKLIRKRSILVLLASRNSIDSYWVRFEIGEALKPVNGRMAHWRDLVIVALDDSGINFYEEYMQIRNVRMHQYYLSALPDLAQENSDELESNARELYQVLGKSPLLRRSFGWDVSLVDMRNRTESQFQTLADHLSQNARIFKSPSNLFLRKVLKASFLYVFLLLAFISLSIGTCIYFLIVRVMSP